MIHVAFVTTALVILHRGDREATESECGTPLLLAFLIVFNLGAFTPMHGTSPMRSAIGIAKLIDMISNQYYIYWST